MVARSELPDVQVGDLSALPLDGQPDLSRKVLLLRKVVEKDAARIPHQAPGPLGNHYTAHDAHEGIQPVPSVKAAENQRADREHGCKGVGKDVEVCGAQVVVLPPGSTVRFVFLAGVPMMVVRAV